MKPQRGAQVLRNASDYASVNFATTGKSNIYHGVTTTSVFDKFKSKFTLSKIRELRPCFCDWINRAEISGS
jgi:hypothetical protein